MCIGLEIALPELPPTESIHSACNAFPVISGNALQSLGLGRILWLAYKEAKAMIQFDAATSKADNNKK
jgi:hypothetical protein